jgi:hypothetical protein
LGKIIGASVGVFVGAIGSSNTTAKDRLVGAAVFGSLGTLAGSWADDMPGNPRGAVIYQKRAGK